MLFWVIWDAQKAALEVKDYQTAIAWSAQTALRDIMGKMMLADILVGRDAIDDDLQRIIDERTTPWGITVQSVEIRDIVIPAGAGRCHVAPGAGRARTAGARDPGRIGKADRHSFADASTAYVHNPTALHLRAMNMLFEGLKQKGALVIVPSSAVDTMNLGGLSGMISLARQNLPTETDSPDKAKE